MVMCLTPFESSMPGSILKALVGNGNRAEPRAFYFMMMMMMMRMMVVRMGIMMMMMRM